MTRRPTPRRRVLARTYGLLGVVTSAAFLALGYISFTANSGLPLTPTYLLTVSVPNAERITKGDEVRVDGVRVGQVQDLTAVSRSGQPAYARLSLALSPSIGPLPVDTRVSIGQASILGDSDVDLVRGHSSTTIAGGGSLPLSDARPTVQLTDLLGIFKRSTARAIHSSLGELAPALAGRGGAINPTLGSLARLLGPLAAVSRTLATTATRLPAFITGYEQTASALSPVSTQLAGEFQSGGTTFDEIALHAGSVAATIEALPPAETAVTGAFARLAPALDGLAQISTELVAPGRLLPATLGQTNTTLAAGLPALARLPRFARVLGVTLGTLQRTAAQPVVPGAVRQLSDLFDAGAPAVSAFEAAQTNCNAIGLWGTNFAAIWIKVGFPGGPNIAPIAITNLGASGESLQHATASPNAANNYLANENAQECEAGNEPHTGRVTLGNPPGLQPDTSPATSPPTGVQAYAQRAGLLTPPKGRR
jgi:phospholipid/cholesterol/gamma-HCH transport system substrate-binding protein